MNPRRILPALLAVAVLVTGLVLAGRSIDRRRSQAKGTLSGFLESQPTEVASRIGGRIAERFVREGATVRAGQPLLRIDAAPEAQANEAQAEASAEAKERLREIENGPRSEEIRHQQAAVAEQAAALEKLRRGPRPEEIGAARARLRRAEAAYAKARAGARPQEIAEAQATEREAAAHLAQVERGLTPEERAQTKARLDAASARAALARADAERFDRLYHFEAVTKQQWDQAQANRQQADAAEKEAREAWRRAEAGNPPEEREQARAAEQRAKAALALIVAGSRPEDIAAAAAGRNEAAENLRLLVSGSRPEDIAAAQARLAGQKAILTELLAGSRREQIAQARAAAKAAKASARESQIRLEERIARAPIDGVVERIPVAVGDLVSAGTLLTRLSAPKDLYLRVFVPEKDLARIRVGDEAALRVDGIDTPITAAVESIDTQGAFTPANLQTPDERGRQVFGVRLRPRSPIDPRLRPGMYATVTRIGTWNP